MPCQCSSYQGNSFTLKCKAIPTQQVAEIFKRPNQTVNIDELELKAATTLGVVHIPANFLSYRKLIETLTLECPSDPNENKQVPITIDPNAFNSSVLEKLNIFNCDLGRLDFSFVAEFRKLRYMMINNASNIEKAKWNQFLILPKYVQLEIRNDKELQNNWNEWVRKLGPLTNGLEKFKCYAGFDDEPADLLVQWLLNSSVATLWHLELQKTKITKIPPGISNFQYIAYDLRITCDDSEIKVLAENSIKFKDLPFNIEISHCGIREIKPGAIQG